jgi:hypothetical protein
VAAPALSDAAALLPSRLTTGHCRARTPSSGAVFDVRAQSR